MDYLDLLCTNPDDTPVASAKAGPSNSLGEVDDEGTGSNGRLWRTVLIGEQEHRIDMQVIRPYLRVITHGGQQKGQKPDTLMSFINMINMSLYHV